MIAKNLRKLWRLHKELAGRETQLYSILLTPPIKIMKIDIKISSLFKKQKLFWGSCQWRSLDDDTTQSGIGEHQYLFDI